MVYRNHKKEQLTDISELVPKGFEFVFEEFHLQALLFVICRVFSVNKILIILGLTIFSGIQFFSSISALFPPLDF